MKIFGYEVSKNKRLDEETKAFKSKIKPTKENTGEGIEDFGLTGISLKNSLNSFNLFYDNYINKAYKNEITKIQNYRGMAAAPEISDVIEDAVIESTQTNEENRVLSITFVDKDIKDNENKIKILKEEFDDLFINRLKINKILWNMLYSYYVDGRIYYERMGKNKYGITGLKKLPAETMDYVTGKDGKIEFFVQYLTKDGKLPPTMEEAKKDPNIIVFYPAQISYVNYGLFGSNQKDVIGYLEKCKQSFNQLKLLETSVIIYRIIRAPERLVFKIDTGNLPRDKAMKFVEKIKDKFQQTETYDPESGQMINKPAVLSMLENFYLPQSADGRGSDISTIGGGNFAAFSQLDDIYFFQRKLYRALKYPMSRISKTFGGNEQDILFAGSASGPITRDEIKWASFLERQQNRICDDLKEIFLLHLEFKGIRKEYELNLNSFELEMTPPNNYKAQMEQVVLESKQVNYNTMAGNPELPRSWLMSEYLDFTDEDFSEMEKFVAKDKKLFPVPVETY